MITKLFYVSNKIIDAKNVSCEIRTASFDNTQETESEFKARFEKENQYFLHWLYPDKSLTHEERLEAVKKWRARNHE